MDFVSLNEEELLKDVKRVDKGDRIFFDGKILEVI